MVKLFHCYLTKSPRETKKLGEELAKKILKTKKQKKAIVLGLEGDLGGGKTTFLKGFARGLGIKKKILSPTFIIMRRFEIKNKNFKNFYHIDCYRIKKTKEILSLGLKKIIFNPQNIVAIEWVDRVKKNLPKNLILIKFKLVNKNWRQIFYGGTKKINYH
jgi:tRNA threonylcarbamoyladenosine biosynthesis protein TsaE